METQAITVTDDSFETLVLAADSPVVVDFWAVWCGPCRMVSPILDEIAAEHADKLTVAKLNVDENPKTAARYKRHGHPNHRRIPQWQPREDNRRRPPKGRARASARRLHQRLLDVLGQRVGDTS
ncbi:hypothetical protein GCM10023193_45670 [Planotetraspora kaengkrachanensis]|uniref:Thioredoxin domain-containing protein n=2 Tax=Planotetraspora kaengkrachanensis TaxID=575193 RepID=A0A8J3Q043_9ACTN|nr:hypothetical protein Pka01_73970 [Planotetraspora kaengkrachanensis]